MDVHREQMLRGYLAMLVVERPYRSLGTGKQCMLDTCTANCCFHGTLQLHWQGFIAARKQRKCRVTSGCVYEQYPPIASKRMS